MTLSCKAGIKILLEDIKLTHQEIEEEFSEGGDVITMYENLISEIEEKLKILRK